jgi:hypothetical protein
VYNSVLVSRQEFSNLMMPFIGLPVTRCFRGGGTAVVMDFGDLFEVDSGPRRPSLRGRAHLLVEWSWRVEGPRSIRFGSWTTDRRMENGLRGLEGKSIVSIGLDGRLPELVIELSGKVWFHSFHTAEGQPQWAFFLAPEGDWIEVSQAALKRRRWMGEDENS